MNKKSIVIASAIVLSLGIATISTNNGQTLLGDKVGTNEFSFSDSSTWWGQWGQWGQWGNQAGNQAGNQEGNGWQNNPNAISTKLTASETTVKSGSAVTLNWTLTNAKTSTLTGGELNLTNVAATGSVEVHPTKTTTYVLQAQDGNGSNGQASVTIEVTP